MFGKFGGIVIIALTGAIIAGLILRPSPDLPPAMNLGVPDNAAAPVNTLETTDDNQDKKPAVIEPVTDSVDTEKKVEDTKEATDTKAAGTETEEPSEATEEKEVEAASAEATTEAETKEDVKKSE